MVNGMGGRGGGFPAYDSSGIPELWNPFLPPFCGSQVIVSNAKHKLQSYLLIIILSLYGYLSGMSDL